MSDFSLCLCAKVSYEISVDVEGSSIQCSCCSERNVCLSVIEPLTVNFHLYSCQVSVHLLLPAGVARNAFGHICLCARVCVCIHLSLSVCLSSFSSLCSNFRKWGPTDFIFDVQVHHPNI